MTSDRGVVLRVAAASDVKACAGSIDKTMQEGKDVVISCIGAGAVNQAFKACAIARGWAAMRSECLAIIPGFRDVEVDGKLITSIVMRPIYLHERETCVGTKAVLKEETEEEIK